MTLPDDLFEMQAQRASGCPDCGERIQAGDTIALVGGAWVHAACPEEKPRPVCSTCFLEIPLSGVCC